MFFYKQEDSNYDKGKEVNFFLQGLTFLYDLEKARNCFSHCYIRNDFNQLDTLRELKKTTQRLFNNTSFEIT